MKANGTFGSSLVISRGGTGVSLVFWILLNQVRSVCHVGKKPTAKLYDGMVK